MNIYLDSSIILRVLLDQPRQFSQWGEWEKAYSSELLGVECRRVIDRLRLEGALDDEALAQTVEEFVKIEKTITRVRVTKSVIMAAARSMPTVVKTLDAFHLVSAMAIRDRRASDLCFATHDSQQATAARALGFSCLES
ncbi:MAG TPA: type II toxin-antitoxin system VapC family toxin [Terriglobia bacterium]|jgi:predicted nucleic acid-binding protein